LAKRVKSIVLSGNGTNCEMEMAHGCKLGGSDEVDIVHISELIHGLRRLDSYHFLNLPGGFLDGDDLGGAKAGANRIKYARIKNTSERLYDQLLKFIEEGKPILGICNGFQLMVKAGLLPGFDRDFETQTVTVTYNDSGRFEDRWVHLKINPRSPCIFTKGMERVYLPVRHGEGKFIPRDEVILKGLHEDGLVVAQYSDENFQQPTMTYPLNPNGSIDAIAGICDESGRLFGMMPHPEAYLYYTNHPRWTRERLPEEGEGVLFFRNAINYIRETLL